MKRNTPIAILDILLGIFLFVMGIVSLMNPVTALEAFVVAYGVGVLVAGILRIVAYVRLTRHVGFSPIVLLLGGIVEVILGILMLTNLGAGTVAITLIFPIWFITSCVVNLFTLSSVNYFNQGARWFTIIANVLGIIVGIMLLFNPFASAATLVYLIGFYLMVIAVMLVIIGISHLLDKSGS